MRKMFALLLCLVMVAASVLPVAATQDTTPTTTGDTPQPVPGGADAMAVVCLVLLVLGGVYLLFTFRRPGGRK